MMRTMKNKTAYFLMILLLVLGSCEYLDYNEDDWNSEEYTFSTPALVSQTLTGIYQSLPSGFNEVGGSMRASAADDAEEAYNLASVHAMNDERWTPNNPLDNNWGAMYGGIRAANQLLKNFDLSILDVHKFNADYTTMIAGFSLYDDQVRFLRAYFYFELMRRYGSVPLLNGAVLSLEEANSVQPGTVEEVVNFIVGECNAVIDSLPVNYGDIIGMTEVDNRGRATKGAAMALKARTLLYAASPLHGSAQAKWEAAAAASWAIIDAGWYALENDYSKVWNNTNSAELILGRRTGSVNSFERSNFPVGYEGAAPGTCPTQNLVDTYEMLNGMDIDEPGSGYDPQNPYANRDPRLEKTIIVNNSTWKGRNVEIWTNGRDGKPLERASKTGYYLKKYVNQSISLDPAAPSTANHLWVLFRYGEVLLNFAEAMNEAYGPTDAHGYGMTAVDALNQIRNRAGLPDYAGNLTQDEVRREIREERRVELAFEDHRFWDIRRWEIGGQTTNIRGMDIADNGDGTFTYNTVTVETRLWNPKMNFYPVPQSELFLNSNLGQNPGWE